MTLIPFDQREGFVWLDGQMMRNQDAKIHVLTHGLHYASSVFEGLRAYNGKIFKLEEHIDRLFYSAKTLDMQPLVTKGQIMQACKDVIEQNHLPNAYIRPLIWRGSEQLGVAGGLTKTHAAVAVWNWGPAFPADVAQNGIVMKTSAWRRPPPECAPVHAKAAGLYMISTLSKRKADQNGEHDALLLDWRGQISEASAANIFLVIDGVLHTPKADCFLDGITRQTIIQLAREKNIQVVERAIFPNELAETQEVFLTGTAYEIMPVRKIDEYEFKPGPITETLRNAYYQLVGR